MQLLSELQRLIKQLQPWQGSWALCGGVVASVYRDTPRFTGDIDVALINYNDVTAQQIAEQVLRELGYNPILGFLPDPRGGGEQTQALLCGRATLSQSFVGVDFLLPVFPWLSKAVIRAQSNMVDFGFSSVPTITIEDLIIAKLNAIQFDTQRPQDIDDLRSLQRSSIVVDYDYVHREARLLGFNVPDWLRLI